MPLGPSVSQQPIALMWGGVFFFWGGFLIVDEALQWEMPISNIKSFCPPFVSSVKRGTTLVLQSR